MKDIHELRIQITAKEKFPRLYCYDLADNHDAQLSKEEILTAVKAAAESNIKKIRLTGGDPLEYDNIIGLVEEIKGVPEIETVALSTNAVFLKDKAADLKKAGLDEIEIYLDTFFEEKYIFMTGGGPIDEVMDGMEAAVSAGMKVRTAVSVIDGLNNDEILTFGQFALNEPIDVIFYERPNKEGIRLKDSDNDLKFMPVEDVRNKFKGAVKVPSADPLIEYCKWFEAQGKLGFVNLERSKEYGAEITAEGKLKASLLDNEPADLSEVLQKTNTEAVKTALRKL